jgi:hypothetical protein
MSTFAVMGLSRASNCSSVTEKLCSCTGTTRLSPHASITSGTLAGATWTAPFAAWRSICATRALEG